MFPERARRPRGIRRALGALAILATLALVSGCSQAAAEERPVPRHHTHTPAHSPAAARPLPGDAGTPVPVVTFDKHAASTDDPASYWVVANKSRALQPVDYAPADLVYPDVPNINGQPMRADVAAAVVAMFGTARSEAGLGLSVQSAYRSYDTQVRVYNDDVAANGREYADTDTARPGHSEHQTGLAVDISAVPANCSLDACFGQTAQGQWLAANAWRFGFLLRYPADKVEVTGFTYEPWHFRYVGADLAAELHKTGVTTLEEFFGLPGGTSYQ